MKVYEVKVWDGDELELWLQFEPVVNELEGETIAVRRFFVDETGPTTPSLIGHIAALAIPALRDALAAMLEDA